MSPEETAAAILTHLQHCPPGCHGDNSPEAVDPDPQPDYHSPHEADLAAGRNYPGGRP